MKFQVRYLALLDPRPRPEGSYKIGSVRPSVRKFSRDLLISFFLKLSMVLGPHIYLCVTTGSFGKNPHQAKMTKNGQKMAQEHGFWTF